MRLLIPLFSPATGTWGGLTRGLAVAKTARAAGHEVAFCAAGDLGKSIAANGYRVYSLPSSTMFGLPQFLSKRIASRSQRMTLPVPAGRAFGSIWFVFWASGIAKLEYLRQSVACQLEAVREFRPDAIFTDVDPAAMITGVLTGRPLSRSHAIIMHHGIGGQAWTHFDRTVQRVLNEYGKTGLSTEELYFGPHVLKIIPSIPELDGADEALPDICYSGHLLGDLQPSKSSQFQPKPGKRYLFVYVGTGSLSLDRVFKVLGEVFPADGPYTCLIGSQSIERPQTIGALELQPYIPAEEVLPYCDWTLCHGGQNTILQSLRRGVPLLVFPGPIFERRFNAQKVAENGAGHMGELDQFNSELVRGMIDSHPACSQAARRLGSRIQSYGGAQAAVDAIFRWAGYDVEKGLC